MFWLFDSDPNVPGWGIKVYLGREGVVGG